MQGPLRTKLALVGDLLQILGSQAVFAVAAAISLPVLARRLGPTGYGEFSLFLTLLTVITYQDFTRPLLVREQTRVLTGMERDGVRLLSLGSTFFLTVLAGLLGLALFPVSVAAVFMLAVWLYGLASLDYGALAAQGRVGLALAIRNAAWSAATLMVTLAALFWSHPLAVTLPFLIANAGILCAYRALAPSSRPRGPLAPASRLQALRTTWRQYGPQSMDLLGFSVAAGIMVSADRLVLQAFVSKADFGAYLAQTDLALKLNVLGSAMAAVLYPALATRVSAQGVGPTARRYYRLASLFVLSWLIGILALLAGNRFVVGLVLGPAFVASRWVFVLTLPGVFVNAIGFLLTPWQRARGDFASQRRAYTVGAGTTTALSLALIPPLGAFGGICAYLGSRIADVHLLVSETRAFPENRSLRFASYAFYLAAATLTLGAFIIASGAST